MASADLTRRVEKVVGYPPPVDMDDHQLGEFHEALLDADRFGDLPARRRSSRRKRTGRSCGWLRTSSSYSSEVRSRKPTASRASIAQPQ
jgi:hypothetical protein